MPKPVRKGYVNLGSLTVEGPPAAEGSAPAPRSVAPVSDRACAKEDSPPLSSWQDSPAAQETSRRIDLHQLSKSLTHRPELKPVLHRSALGPAREFYGPALSSVYATLSVDAAPPPASSPPEAAKRPPTAKGLPPAVARRSPAAAKLSLTSAWSPAPAADRPLTTAGRSPIPARVRQPSFPPPP